MRPFIGAHFVVFKEKTKLENRPKLGHILLTVSAKFAAK